MLAHIQQFRQSGEMYLVSVTIFFFILGSQVLVNHWVPFILFALLIIDWKRFFTRETLLLVLFLFSLVASHIYIYTHYGVLGNEDSPVQIFIELFMILSVYLLGLSLRGANPEGRYDDRKLFYLLTSFFVAYTLVVIYSYFAFPIENSTVGIYGMHLYYTAIESAKHIHHQNRLLAPTIVAYSLTMMAILIPFILFNVKKSKAIGFKTIEILLLTLIAFTALYFTFMMGRRITIALLLVLAFFFILMMFIQAQKKEKIRIAIASVFFMAIVAITLYYFRDSISLFERIAREGIGDSSRFLLWSQGWDTMLEYPWGGGGFKISYALNGRTHYYAHDAWLDIGKRFGVIPLLLMVLFWLMHVPYLVKIIRGKRISNYMKILISIIALGIFANWFVEPVPLVHRSYFFYTMFFLGFLKSFSDSQNTTGLAKN